MSGDIEVLVHLFSSMEELADKLEKASSLNKLDLTNKLKVDILEISKNVSKELQ